MKKCSQTTILNLFSIIKKYYCLAFNTKTDQFLHMYEFVEIRKKIEQVLGKYKHNDLDHQSTA